MGASRLFASKTRPPPNSRGECLVLGRRLCFADTRKKNARISGGRSCWLDGYDTFFDEKTLFWILECPFFGAKIPEKVFREILKVGCGRGGGRGRRRGRIEKIRKNSRKMTDFSWMGCSVELQSRGLVQIGQKMIPYSEMMSDLSQNRVFGVFWGI